MTHQVTHKTDGAEHWIRKCQGGLGSGANDGDDIIVLTLEVIEAFVLGDVNCDGVVNLLDVDPFVDLISVGGYFEKADINEDGVLNLLDVGPFVALLSGG